MPQCEAEIPLQPGELDMRVAWQEGPGGDRKEVGIYRMIYLRYLFITPSWIFFSPSSREGGLKCFCKVGFIEVVHVLN
jgi:hypothetical protein